MASNGLFMCHAEVDAEVDLDEVGAEVASIFGVNFVINFVKTHFGLADEETISPSISIHSIDCNVCISN